MKKLREEVELRVGKQLEIFGEGEDGNNDVETGVRWVEIFQSTSMDRLVAALEKKGFALEHYKANEKPLYHLSNGDDDQTPIHSLPELLDTIRDLGRKGLTIQRYKGLGEMNPDQLYDTTMDPQHRKLLRVTLENNAMADEIFTILMGEEVAPRRNFIETNAMNVRNLDV